MNTLELFKLLPRTNCRKCGPGTCMGLAVAMSRGDLTPDDCPELTPEGREALRAKLPKGSDWREDLVRNLLSELWQGNLAARQEALSLSTIGPNSCTLYFMGKTIEVTRDRVGTSLDPWDQILVLRYVLGPGGAPPTGVWTAFREMKDGRVKAEGFRKECERPLAALYNRNKADLSEKLQSLGGQPVPDQTAPFAFGVMPLPRIPLLLLVWPGDEEFGADAKILLDETAPQYLDVESLIFLGERLIHRLEE